MGDRNRPERVRVRSWQSTATNSAGERYSACVHDVPLTRYCAACDRMERGR